MKTCTHCHEEVLPGERVAPYMNPPLHWECALRAVVGGVNHQKGLCMCCGGTEEPDPPGLTRREAAKEAADYWQMRQNMDLILRAKGVKD
jgi:hypothetical protein